MGGTRAAAISHRPPERPGRSHNRVTGSPARIETELRTDAVNHFLLFGSRAKPDLYAPPGVVISAETTGPILRT